jgi:hypothetical protein
LSGLPAQVESITDEENEPLDNYRDRRVTITLASHTSKILKINGEASFEQCRKSIKKETAVIFN